MKGVKGMRGWTLTRSCRVLLKLWDSLLGFTGTWYWVFLLVIAANKYIPFRKREYSLGYCNGGGKLCVGGLIL